MITRHLVITGKVQGVWYREAMRIEAERLGVTGWVRNRRDGAVEAMAQGSEEAVDTLIAWARRGPPAAVVADVAVSEGSGAYTAFERLPTA
ncbi:MAG: acylphosphatase [Gallionellaceae bacterium]|nr:acylphosphatase [Gallionellaceae bacterium]